MARPAVIATHITGSVLNGTLMERYKFLAAPADEFGEMHWSARSYSTPANARLAARRAGLKPLRGVALGERFAANMIRAAISKALPALQSGAGQ